MIDYDRPTDPTLDRIARDIVACRRCPRLVKYLDACRERWPDHRCRPVPGFGDESPDHRRPRPGHPRRWPNWPRFYLRLLGPVALWDAARNGPCVPPGFGATWGRPRITWGLYRRGRPMRSAWQ